MLYAFLFIVFSLIPNSFSWIANVYTISSRLTNPFPKTEPVKASQNEWEGEQYTVVLGLPPLGIVFEDIGMGYPPKGVEVVALAPGGKGELCEKIRVGDKLKTCTAVKNIPGSAKFNVVDVDCTQLDFDTVVSAISSNQAKFGCDRIEMTFVRPNTTAEE